MHQYTLAQPTSRRRELGCATLQPTPDPSHKHFSEFQWEIFDFRKIPQGKKTVPLWYPPISHKELFLVGNATRGRPSGREVKRAGHAKVPAEVPEDSRVLRERRLWFPTSDRLPTWLIPSVTTGSRKWHESTMVWDNLPLYHLCKYLLTLCHNLFVRKDKTKY